MSIEVGVIKASTVASRREKGALRSLVTTTLRRGWEFISDNLTFRSTRELVASMRTLHAERLERDDDNQAIIDAAVAGIR